MANWTGNNHCKEKMDKEVRGSELRRYEIEMRMREGVKKRERKREII